MFNKEYFEFEEDTARINHTSLIMKNDTHINVLFVLHQTDTLFTAVFLRQKTDTNKRERERRWGVYSSSSSVSVRSTVTRLSSLSVPESKIALG